jgi:hypothetical protein
MRLVLAITILALLWSGCSAPTSAKRNVAQSAEASDVLREVRRVVPQASAPQTSDDLSSLLPAHFSSRNAETERRAGPSLTGEELYLFPGGHYCFVEWGCVLPPTIYDRGQWVFRDGVLELKSDGFLSRKGPMRDRRYVPLFHTVAGRRTLLLMGTTWDFPYFKEKAKPNDDFMLFLCTLTRIDPIPTARADSMRQELYAKSWRPEFFK